MPRMMPSPRWPRRRASHEAPKIDGRGGVAERVRHPHTPLPPVGDVDPFRPAGERGGTHRQHSQADELLRGGGGAFAADEVEQRRAGPCPDGGVGQDGVQRVALPRAAEQILDRPRSQSLGQRGEPVRYLVEAWAKRSTIEMGRSPSEVIMRALYPPSAAPNRTFARHDLGAFGEGNETAPAVPPAERERKSMPKRKKVTKPVVKAGKKVLATDTAQGIIGAVVDKVEEIAVDKADDAAKAVKGKAAKVAKPQAGRSEDEARQHPPGEEERTPRSRARQEEPCQEVDREAAPAKKKTTAKRSSAQEDRRRRAPQEEAPPRGRPPSGVPDGSVGRVPGDVVPGPRQRPAGIPAASARVPRR